MSLNHAGNCLQLKLRPLESRDLTEILSWRNREDARVWFKTCTPITEDQHLSWFKKYSESSDDYHYIVESDGRKVGQAAVYHINQSDGSAEIGRFLVAPEESGKGYMKHACAQLVSLCRQTFGLSYIYLEVFEKNTRAIRIYEACGFQTESVAKGLIRMGQSLVGKT
jgi:UDP-4-amino-4,6-dideoxy-N-acetyl-beta-L-altrosamine N-acetyltransferase